MGRGKKLDEWRETEIGGIVWKGDGRSNEGYPRQHRVFLLIDYIIIMYSHITSHHIIGKKNICLIFGTEYM